MEGGSSSSSRARTKKRRENSQKQDRSRESFGFQKGRARTFQKTQSFALKGRAKGKGRGTANEDSGKNRLGKGRERRCGRQEVQTIRQHEGERRETAGGQRRQNLVGRRGSNSCWRKELRETASITKTKKEYIKYERESVADSIRVNQKDKKKQHAGQRQLKTGETKSVCVGKGERRKQRESSNGGVKSG